MNNFKFESTLDGQKKLKKEFEKFSDMSILIYEHQTDRVVGEPYIESSCWVSFNKNEFFFYEFESFVTPGGHLSSSDYNIEKVFFPDLQSLYNWSKTDKRYLEIFNLADSYCINKSKDDIDNMLPLKDFKSTSKVKL